MKECANRFLSLIILWILTYGNAHCQKGQLMPIDRALINIAKEHKVNLIFDKSILPVDHKVLVIKGALRDQISHVLKGLDIKFIIEPAQVLLLEKRMINGIITDEETGEALIGATILEQNSNAYTISNEDGLFSFATYGNKAEISISYVGYNDTLISIDLGQNAIYINVGLESNNYIAEVLVTDQLVTVEPQGHIDLYQKTDVTVLSNQANSAIGGEADIYQSIIRQPGVTTGADGIGGIHVRGGKSGHNVVLYDGIRLYNPNHAFGLYSVVNQNMVDKAKLVKGGADGHMIGGLSSTMRINLRDPNLQKTELSGQISSVASQALISIPIIKNKVGLLVNGRRTHLDPVITRLTRAAKERNASDGKTSFHFYDINARLSGQFGSKHRIEASFFTNRDVFDDSDLTYEIRVDDDFLEYEGLFDAFSKHNWGNTVFGLKYSYLLGRKSVLNISVSSSAFEYNSLLSDYFTGQEVEGGAIYFDRVYTDFSSRVEDKTVHIFGSTDQRNHQLSYGLKLEEKVYNLGTFSTDVAEGIDPNDPEPPLDIISFLIGKRASQSATIYIADKWAIGPKWRLLYGLYGTGYRSFDRDLPDDIELSLSDFNWRGYIQPVYQYTKGGFIGATFRSSLQYDHLLSPADNSYPNDIWIPSTRVLGPQQGIEGEVFSSYSSGPHRIKASIFYKKASNQTLIDSLAPIPTLSDFLADEWEEIIRQGEMISKGVEASYSYHLKDVAEFQATYTYLDAKYTFKDVNDGFPFQHEYSIPHTFNIGSNVFLSSNWAISLDWYYASGKIHTLYESVQDFTPIGRGIEWNVFPLSGYNDFRLPSQHKLSVSVSTKWNFGAVRNNLSMGVQNVYNRRNAIYQYEFDQELKTFSGFPIMPILKYQVKWKE